MTLKQNQNIQNQYNEEQQEDGSEQDKEGLSENEKIPHTKNPDEDHALVDHVSRKHLSVTINTENNKYLEFEGTDPTKSIEGSRKSLQPIKLTPYKVPSPED